MVDAPDTISNRPNTSGTRGGRAGVSPFPQALEQYSKDNEQDFRTKVGKAVDGLRTVTGTARSYSASDILNDSDDVSGSSVADALDALFASLALKAPLASPALTGAPTSPTAAPGTNTTQIATTAFVTALGVLKANLASPTFTGVPAAPTASQANNTTQIATTAYVDTGIGTKEPLGEMTGIDSQAASYTLVLADKGKTVEVSNASANTLTIPPNSSVAFPVKSYVNVVQMGAGQTTVTAGAGVTLRNRNGLKLGGQYAMATLYQRAADEWVVGGDLTT